MDITQVRFIRSSPDLKSCPAPSFPEYAFAGRSNVGKSTLINMITEQKNLAKTSSTPGKTQYINHFLINESWYLVDLPGYGYAKTSHAAKMKFPGLIQEYLLGRATLACLFVLIDCRHKPLGNDVDFISWAGQHQIPLVICFTKTDKLSKAQLERNLEVYKSTLGETWEELPRVLLTSSIQHHGRAEMMGIIQKANHAFHNT